jgi:hypothetical protein
MKNNAYIEAMTKAFKRFVEDLQSPDESSWLADPVPMCFPPAAIYDLPEFLGRLPVLGSAVLDGKPPQRQFLPVKRLNASDFKEQIDTVGDHFISEISKAKLANKQIKNMVAGVWLTHLTHNAMHELHDQEGAEQSTDAVLSFLRKMQKQTTEIQMHLEAMWLNYTLLITALLGEADAHIALKRRGRPNGRESGVTRRGISTAKQTQWRKDAIALRKKHTTLSCRGVAARIANSYGDSSTTHAYSGSVETIRKAIADLFPRKTS